MQPRRIAFGLVVVALLCVVGLSNDTDLARMLGLNVAQLHGKTDEEGKLTVKCDFLGTTIEGLARGEIFGDVLRNVPTQVLLEPRPGIAEIQGLGNIGAVWVGLYGYEWTRVTGFGLNWTATGASIDLGEVALRPKLTVACEITHREVLILGEAGDQHLALVYGTCTAELTFEFDPIKGLFHAKRVTQLPARVGPFCTWVVVEKADRDQVAQTTYHSDGRVWIEWSKEVMRRVPSLPATAEHRQRFIVKGAGGKEYVYWWYEPDPSLPGKWIYSHEWTPVKEETPAEDPAEPGEPGGPGEPGAG
ncbi:MAG: hypothetical protein AB1543_05115 [Candidatus Bipolaricaulota bacterium]